MNDDSEVLHILEPLQYILEEEYNKAEVPFMYKQKEGKAAFEEIVSDIKKDITESKFLSYIACFSMAGNDLGQWRAYGDNGKGVAIEFDGKTLYKIARQVKATGGSLWFTNVTYSDEAKIDFLKCSIVPIIFSALQNAGANGNVMSGYCPYDRMVRIMCCSDIAAVLLAAVQYKHNAYAAEQEWRLCLHTFTNATWIEKDHINFMTDKHYGDLTLGKIDIRLSGDKLISYFDLNFEKFLDYKDMIKSVTLGPKSSINRDDADLLMLLKTNGFNIQKWAIKRSDIPYA